MPRIWFSGPRLLGGLLRPGISFSTQELSGSSKPSRDPSRGEILEVIRRPDGAMFMAVSNHNGANESPPPGSESCHITAFYSTNEALEVRRGTGTRLRAHIDPDGWISGLSLGQIVAAMRAETSALEFERVPLNPEAVARLQREGLEAKVPQMRNWKLRRGRTVTFPCGKGLAFSWRSSYLLSGWSRLSRRLDGCLRNGEFHITRLLAGSSAAWAAEQA